MQMSFGQACLFAVVVARSLHFLVVELIFKLDELRGGVVLLLELQLILEFQVVCFGKQIPCLRLVRLQETKQVGTATDRVVGAARLVQPFHWTGVFHRR